MNHQPKNVRLRSFVRRNSRKTSTQIRALQEAWPQFGLCLSEGLIDYKKVFLRQAPCFLEIGFGSGQSLLALAMENRDKNFIGVETYKPGIGALLHGILQHELDNIRVYDQDAVDVLEQVIPNDSLTGIQIFFPDPWQKRRHHTRRLIQQEFVSLIVKKMKMDGTLHLATDWDDYAKQMLKVLSQEKCLTNQAGLQIFSSRSIYRPVMTKFEKRAEREGRQIWELQFKKHSTA